VPPTPPQEKRLRKAAEQDALRLYNRVRQLQREEVKAAKRIQETRQRAREVLSLRERNQQKAREKELRLRELQVEVAKQRKHNVIRKEVNRRNKDAAFHDVMDFREAMAQTVRVERALLEDEMQREKIVARKQAVQQKLEIRRQHEIAARKAEQRKVAELIAAHEDYESRVAAEVAVRQKKEKELQEMAQLELQLIEKLKRKQIEQIEAYTELEDVLGTKPPSTAQKPPSSARSAKPSARSSARPAAERSSAGPARESSRASAGAGAATPPPEAMPSEASGEPVEPTEEEIAMAFAQYDEEGTGAIGTTLLDPLMRDLGVPLDAAQLAQAVSQLDRSGAGEISFGEFLLWWRG